MLNPGLTTSPIAHADDGYPSAVRARSAPRVVRAGFIPLIDVAVLVAAAEQGFAAREGIRLELVRDVSWSNIRDRLAFRQFDVAHALSPMPVASQLGIGSNPYPSFTPFALGRGGNAITLSVELYREMTEVADLTGEDALASAKALRTVIDRRSASGRKPLVFGMTYPYSSHNYEFRYWMAAGGVDPDRDVTMTVVPPPFTADAMAAAAIDGFCVNAPWNLVAVERGVGRIVATKRDIWPSAPEKVLAVRPDWADANEETLFRLLVALDAAARWCDDPANIGDLAEMLADPAHIGVRAELFRDLLRGRLQVDQKDIVRDIPDYLVFHREFANFPWVSQARWVYSQMIRWGQAAYSEEGADRAAAAYRPDLYRAALGAGRLPMPLADEKLEGLAAGSSVATTDGDLALAPDPFIDGHSFDPAELRRYVAEFPIARSGPIAAAGS